MNITEVKKLLKEHGKTLKDFHEWMRGQTVGLNNDGSTDYYDWDVMRFLGR